VITVLISITTRTEKAEVFAELTRVECRRRSLAPGALRVELLRSEANPAHFTLLETFATQEAIDDWYNSDDYREWHSSVRDLIVSWDGHDQIRLFDGSPEIRKTSDPSFNPDGPTFIAGCLPALNIHRSQSQQSFSATMPETGIGDLSALEMMAPVVLGGSRDLGAPGSFDHMDPPTPWVTWVTALWNASLNQNLLHPSTAPAATMIEKQTIGWLAEPFGMTGGHLTGGSTLANLTALWAARERKRIRRIVASEAAHVSIAKAANILGLAHEVVETTSEGCIDPSALPDGLSDAALVLTAGATGTGAVDDLHIGEEAAWRHVDAAWAGPLVFSELHKHKLVGLGSADSVSVSLHKWVYQPKESAAVLFKDAQQSTDAISFGAKYLTVPNVGILGSASARAVPLMTLLLAWGRKGLAQRIERSISDAESLRVALAQCELIEMFPDCGTGVLLWRPKIASFDDVYERLPPGMASRATVKGVEYLRHVAANPLVDVPLIAECILKAIADCKPPTEARD